MSYMGMGVSASTEFKTVDAVQKNGSWACPEGSYALPTTGDKPNCVVGKVEVGTAATTEKKEGPNWLLWGAIGAGALLLLTMKKK